MDTTPLRHFVAAAEELHFAHAARSLNIPRMTLLGSVRALEAELGSDLFDRTAETTVLTDAGRALLPTARLQIAKADAHAEATAAKPGGKAKASKGKGRAPAVKGERRPGKRRQSR